MILCFNFRTLASATLGWKHYYFVLVSVRGVALNMFSLNYEKKKQETVKELLQLLNSTTHERQNKMMILMN